MRSDRPPRSGAAGWFQPLALVLRLLVMGVGLGVLTGTVLKQLAPRVAQGAMDAPRMVRAARPVM